VWLGVHHLDDRLSEAGDIIFLLRRRQEPDDIVEALFMVGSLVKLAGQLSHDANGPGGYRAARNGRESASFSSSGRRLSLCQRIL
jgi:hypothetical protein